MQAFVRHNLQSLLDDASLSDVTIEAGRNKHDRRTFHCVGALVAPLLKQIYRRGRPSSSSPCSPSKSELELVESKEAEEAEIGTSAEDTKQGGNDDNINNSIRGLEDDSDGDEQQSSQSHNSQSHVRPRVVLSDLSATTFAYLRRLFYGLNPLLSLQNVIGIYSAAVKYELTALQSAALQYIESIHIEQHPAQFMSLLVDCQQCHLYAMIDQLVGRKIPDHISESLFTLLINNAYFGRLSNAVVETLLALENASFRGLSQEHLWIAILKWAKSQCRSPRSMDDSSADGQDAKEEEAETATQSKRELIKLSSDDDDTRGHKSIHDLVQHPWDASSLQKLRHFVRYFAFAKMSNLFFRRYVLGIDGLLSQHEVIGVLQTHCDDMRNAMKAMQNVIELQTYDMNYNHSTNRYQMFKTKEMCFHAVEGGAVESVFHARKASNAAAKAQKSPAADCGDDDAGDNDDGFSSVASYDFPELKQFVEQNIKSLFEHSNEETSYVLHDVVFEVGTGDATCDCLGIRSLFAIHSPVFKSMLYGTMLESQSTTHVVLRDMTKDVFEWLRLYFYGFLPVITHENVIGLFYSGDKYLIPTLKESAMQFVNDMDVSHDIDAFLYILSELQKYNLCAIWSAIIGAMMKTVDVDTSQDISQFLRVLRKLHECGLASWRSTIEHMHVEQGVTCQKLLFDDEFARLPAAVAHQFMQTFHEPFYETRIDQETLWNATLAWAKAQCDGDGTLQLNRLIESFVPYFNFATMDAEFVREHVEPVQVLSDSQRITIYRAHSMLLTKVLTELGMATKQHKERQQTLESQLRNAERSIRALKKQHKSESAQLLSQYTNTVQMQQQQQSRPQSLSTHSMTRPSSHSCSHSYSHSHPQSLSHVPPASHSHSHAHAMSMAMSSSSLLVPALMQQHGQNDSNGDTHSTTTAMATTTTSTHASSIDDVRFEWYSHEYLSVSKHGKQISTIRDDCAWLLSYLNFKCADGAITIFSICAHECEHGYDAIGIVSVRDVAFVRGKHFNDAKLGSQYCYAPAQHVWSSGQVITVLVDCISGRVVFKKNGIVVQESDIVKHKTYYPVLQICGCAGHKYEIIEYKCIRSSICKR